MNLTKKFLTTSSNKSFQDFLLENLQLFLQEWIQKSFYVIYSKIHKVYLHWNISPSIHYSIYPRIPWKHCVRTCLGIHSWIHSEIFQRISTKIFLWFIHKVLKKPMEIRPNIPCRMPLISTKFHSGVPSGIVIGFLREPIKK